MKDSDTMVRFLENLLLVYTKDFSDTQRAYWADHPLEFVSSCYSSLVGLHFVKES